MRLSAAFGRADAVGAAAKQRRPCSICDKSAAANRIRNKLPQKVDPNVVRTLRNFPEAPPRSLKTIRKRKLRGYCAAIPI